MQHYDPFQNQARSVKAAIEQMLKMANQLGDDVVARINDVKVWVEPGDDLSELIAKFEKDEKEL